MFCNQCGSQLSDGAKFCASCGQALTQPQAGAQQAGQQYAKTEYVTAGQQSQTYGPLLNTYIPAGGTKAKSKLPLILGLAGGAAIVVVATVALIIGGARAALNKAAGSDYYEIGNDKIPSVKLALGEESKVIGISTSTEDGATIQEITYSAPEVDQGGEMFAYMDYLRENDGFLLVTDVDFSSGEGSCGLGRNSVDDGYEILIKIAYNEDGYTITLVRQEGGITPIEEPTPESTTQIAAQSVFGLIDSGTFHMSMVIIDGDSDGVEMELFKKDGRSAMVLKGNGMYVRRLTMDQKFYTVLDEYETVVISDIDPSEIPPVEYNSAELTYVGEGSGEWDGTAYPYSEYKGARGEQMFYFMDGNVLKGIRSISPAGNTVNCDIRAFDSVVPDDAFEWPAHYVVDDPDAVDIWIGLWRYEGEDGLELIHLMEDGTFLVISRFEGPDGNNQYTGDYGASEGEMTLYNVLVNGEPTGDMEIPWLVEGDVIILGGEDDASYYYRVPKEDEAKVLADPLAPYTNKHAAGPA